MKKRYVRTRRNRVPAASQVAHGPLASIRTLTSAKRVRVWLGAPPMSEIGREVARLTQRKEPFDRRTVFGWENGKPMSAETLDAYGVLIANELTRRLHREVGVKLAVNSPWRITAWVQCGCGAWFRLRHPRMRRCERCRRGNA